MLRLFGNKPFFVRFEQFFIPIGIQLDMAAGPANGNSHPCREAFLGMMGIRVYQADKGLTTRDFIPKEHQVGDNLIRTALGALCHHEFTNLSDSQVTILLRKPANQILTENSFYANGKKTSSFLPPFPCHPP
jgi:hypothetical protein